MKLNLNEFFLELNSTTYCIIKPDTRLPNYTIGSDLDIFCYDIDTLVKIILKVGNQYIDKGLEIDVINMEGQIYIDFICLTSGSIEFRFDLYSRLPLYENVFIKPAFFENI